MLERAVEGKRLLDDADRRIGRCDIAMDDDGHSAGGSDCRRSLLDVVRARTCMERDSGAIGGKPLGDCGAAAA
jgi:hypothetical protein